MTGDLGRRARNLADLALDPVVAHGGEGLVGFCRVLDASDFQGPWNFVDYAVVPPGASIGLHAHGDDEELYLVLAGEGLMRVDGHELRVRPGHVVLNRPGGRHGLVNDGTEPLRLFVVEVSLRGRER